MSPSAADTDTLPLTDRAVQQDTARLSVAARDCLAAAGKLMLRILDFSDFHIKKLESSDKKLERQLNQDPVKVAWDNSLLHPSMPRPHFKEIWAAMPRGRQPEPSLIANEDETSATGTGQQAWLNSLGRTHLMDGSVAVRMTSLSLEANKVKGVKKLGAVSSYEEMEDILASISNKITRRTVCSCLGQVFDFTGRQCAQAISLFKACCVSMYDAGGQLMDWDEVISAPSLHLFLLAVSAFFDSLNHPLPRCHLHFHAKSLYLLCGMGDAGGSMHAFTLHAISILEINNKSTSQVLPLSMQTYIHRKTLTTPLAELFSLQRVAAATVRHRELLDTLGICIQPHNVLLLTDSTLNMIRSRTRASRYSTRCGHLLSKFQLTLLTGNLNSFQNVILFDTSKGIFLPDLLTKVIKNSTRASLQLQAETIRAPGWLGTDPSTWHTFLIRDAFIPKELTRSLLTDLESNPEYITELQADLIDLAARSHPFRIGEVVPQILASTVLVKTSPVVAKLNLSLLMDRKLNSGIEGRSVAAILSKVAFYVWRLRLLCRLAPPARQEARLRLKNQYRMLRTSFQPWCGTKHCQLLDTAVGDADRGNVCRLGKHHNIDRDLDVDESPGWRVPAVPQAIRHQK
jgi:hypothetical protein